MNPLYQLLQTKLHALSEREEALRETVARTGELYSPYETRTKCSLIRLLERKLTYLEIMREMNDLNLVEKDF